MIQINPIVSKGIINLSQLGCKLIKTLPQPIKSTIEQPLIDHLFSKHFNADDLEFLEGKILCIEICDLNHREFFTVTQQKIAISPSTSTVNEGFDVKLSGDVHSFISLMKQQVDPDTLFFQRKLMISGDTELGLEVKALFDYFQWESLPLFIRQPIDLVQAIFSQNTVTETHQASPHLSQ